MAKPNYKLWFKLHGYCSLPIWIIFCFVCITGTIAVVSHELTWLTNPNSRASNPEQLSAKPTAELVQIVESAYPTADINSVLAFESYLVNAVIFTDKDHPFAIAYVNQYTGEIQEVNNGITFINFMRSLHSWLLFPWHVNFSVGYYLVCFMALVMMGALVTGLVIYKKFWRSFLTPTLRFHQGKKTFITDLHKLSGVWSLWFLLLMSLTGLWYLVQAIYWHMDIEIEPEVPSVAIAKVTENNQAPAPEVTLQQAIDIVKQKHASFEPTYVMLPEHHRDSYKIMGRGDHVFYDEYAYSLAVDPGTGEVVHELTPENMNTLQTIAHIADPIHFGYIGGLWTKILWFFCGILISGMSITGFLIWNSRQKKVAQRVKTQINDEDTNLEGLNHVS